MSPNVPNPLNVPKSPTVPSVPRVPSVSPLSPGRCRSALGMEDGTIPDFRLSASSAWSDSTAARHGRYAPVWTSMDQYGPVDLGRLHLVTLVGTQGRHAWGHGRKFARQYRLRYSRDRRRWLRWRDRWGAEVIGGNEDPEGVVLKDLSPAPVARALRVYPRAPRAMSVCLRLELYGCPWEGECHLRVTSCHLRATSLPPPCPTPLVALKGWWSPMVVLLVVALGQLGRGFVIVGSTVGCWGQRLGHEVIHWVMGSMVGCWGQWLGHEVIHWVMGSTVGCWHQWLGHEVTHWVMGSMVGCWGQWLGVGVNGWVMRSSIG
uniref:Uncharacterized protein n=1 Tax=Geospiza parvula TaxID=87175 RepID=A0A8U8BNW6_GEOPR